jgi:preprotein translocase subunit Sss1
LVCSKIYRVGILMYGKKPTWKELYKWQILKFVWLLIRLVGT